MLILHGGACVYFCNHACWYTNRQVMCRSGSDFFLRFSNGGSEREVQWSTVRWRYESSNMKNKTQEEVKAIHCLEKIKSHSLCDTLIIPWMLVLQSKLCVWGKKSSMKQQIHWRRCINSYRHIKSFKYTMQVIHSAPLITCHKQSEGSDDACHLLFHPSWRTQPPSICISTGTTNSSALVELLCFCCLQQTEYLASSNPRLSN